MPAFRFRLEPALKLRRHAESEAKRQLAERIKSLEAKEQELQSLGKELSAAVDERRLVLLQMQLPSDALLSGLGWMESIKGRMAQTHAAVSKANLLVEEARQSAWMARRAVKILETLRERRYQQWRIQENRRQDAIASDLAGMRWQAQKAS